MVNYCLKLIGKGIIGAVLIFGILKGGDYVKKSLYSDVKLEYEGKGGRFDNDGSWGQGYRDEERFYSKEDRSKKFLKKIAYLCLI